MRWKGTNGAGTKGLRTVFLGQIPRAPSVTSAMAFPDQAGQPDFARVFPGNNNNNKKEPITNMCLAANSLADRNPGLSSSKVPLWAWERVEQQRRWCNRMWASHLPGARDSQKHWHSPSTQLQIVCTQALLENCIQPAS